MAQVESELRRRLYKDLYNSARRCIKGRSSNDAEAVKIVRDNAVDEMYGKAYKSLKIDELRAVINQLDLDSGAADFGQITKPTVATAKQIKMLRFYALGVALKYFDFESVSFFEEESGQSLSGEPLRDWLRVKFEERKSWLPAGIFARLWADYINPKSHEFLEQGGFKKWTGDRSQFHYERLSPQEAQYLINRYSAIFGVIEKRNYQPSIYN